MQHSVSTLTGRQQEVLALIASGRSNRQIAGALGISEQGVKSHVSRLLLRHDVPNRTALVAATHAWNAAVDDAMDGVVAGVRHAVAERGAKATNGGRGVSVESLRRQAAELSSDAPAEIKQAIERLRDIIRELTVALELARDLPPGESSKVLGKAVGRRTADAARQVARLEGAIAAARR